MTASGRRGVTAAGGGSAPAIARGPLGFLTSASASHPPSCISWLSRPELLALTQRRKPGGLRTDINSLTVLETRRLKSRRWRGPPPPKLRGESCLASLWPLVVAVNPWCAVAYSGAISASVVTWSPPCVPLSSHGILLFLQGH